MTVVPRDAPNMLSVANGIFGIFAIMYAIDGAFVIASGLILCAMAMDGLDGLVARRFGLASRVGKELDSIADMVSFCMAPAVLIYSWHYDPKAGTSLLILTDYTYGRAVNFLTVIAAASGMMFGMYRLIRYRTNDFDLPYFNGIPTPSFAFFVISGIYILPAPPFLIVTAGLALLMISNVRYPKLKGGLILPGAIGMILIGIGLAMPGIRSLTFLPALGLIGLYYASPFRVLLGTGRETVNKVDKGRGPAKRAGARRR